MERTFSRLVPMKRTASFKFILSFLLCGGLFSACGERPSLEEYASEVREASRPGVAIHRFVDSTLGLPPHVRLARCFEFMNRNWTYIPNPPGDDRFPSAESLVRHHSFHGACQSFSVTMLACCRAIGLTGHICLGAPRSGRGDGHAWVEVAICPRADMDTSLHNELHRVFGESVSIVVRNGSYWMQLTPSGSLVNYRITHAIDSSGNLTSINDRPD